MNFYLAARYSRRVELCRYRGELEGLGHRVTSRWLNGTHESTEELSPEAAFEHRQQFSAEDIADLLEADTIVNFTEPPNGNGKGAGRGGRHVEFGVALGCEVLRQRHLPLDSPRFRLIVIGHRENVFHCLPCIEFYATWPEAMEALKGTDLLETPRMKTT